jgi:hypothetical protein
MAETSLVHKFSGGPGRLGKWICGLSFEIILPTILEIFRSFADSHNNDPSQHENPRRTSMSTSPHGKGNGGVLIGVAALEILIATTFVFARLWTRSTISHAIGWDDYAITFAWVRNEPIYEDPLHICIADSRL